MEHQPNKNNFNMDLNLNLLVPPSDIMSSNRLSSDHNSNRVLLLKKEISNSKTLFNTFSSNKNTKENKSQNIVYNNITNYNKGKKRKINKAKSANYKNTNYYYQEEENKDSYLYLVKLKKYYSTHNCHNLNNTNKSKYSSHTHNSKKSKKKVNHNNELNNTNNYYTINNFYINSKLSMTFGSNNTKNNFNNFNKYNTIQRNISHSYFNKTNEIRKDLSEILNTRKKFNETYNHFYDIRNKKDNKNKNRNGIGAKTNDVMEYSSLNEYWNKRNQDNVKKIVKIKNELLKKGKKEIKSVPKINDKSKELAINLNKNKNDNFKFNNIFDKLFQNKNLNHSHIYQKKEKEKENSKPKINEKSEKMKRTINDLYLWNNKRQKNIKEKENKIYRKEIFNKKNINLTSETILKERRPFYINKKVEDRLIEQGKHLKIKNNKLKEKCIKEMTEQKKYINNNYNQNNKIKSKYLPKEESKNNDINNKRNSNIFNCNYDYNINVFNKRTALFDKSKSNIIQELNEKIDKGNKIANKNPRTLLLQNYMLSKINQNKNNFKIKYNVTDIDDQENKKENIIEDQNKLDEIEELKLGLINNDNYEKNQFSVNKNISMNNSDRIRREKSSNIYRIKDKRKEDLKKIIDFSEKLYKNQNKIIS